MTFRSDLDPTGIEIGASSAF